MQLQVGDVVEEVQLGVGVRQLYEVLEARRERARQLPQQIHMLLHGISLCERIRCQQTLSIHMLHLPAS